MVIYSKYVVPKGYIGITLFPFVVLRKKELAKDSILMRHERIHLQQQMELLVLPFYIIYSLEFIMRWVYLRNWHRAYRAISFEKEAYANETDAQFLKKRPLWNFVTYF